MFLQQVLKFGKTMRTIMTKKVTCPFQNDGTGQVFGTKSFAPAFMWMGTVN